ncbi:MAG TPA: membrane protein insertase YidC [Verrucomicrobiae bacterium]
MDKTGIIVVAICAVLLVFGFIEQTKIAEQRAQYAATNQLALAQSQLAANASTASNAVPETAAVTASTVTTPVYFNTNLPEQTIVLTNGSPHHDWVRYTFTSRGGGLKVVELMDYPETVSARWREQVHSGDKVASLNARADVPVLALLGDPKLVGDGNFTLTRTGDGLRAEKTLADGLMVTKEFHISSNYLVTATVTLKNGSSEPLALPAQELVVGTAEPMDVDDGTAPQTESVMWFDGTNAVTQPLMWFQGSGGCSRGAPRPEFRAGAGDVVWAAADNQFFAMLVMPKQPAAGMVARTITLPRFQDTGVATNSAPPQGIQTALVYPSQTLAANADIARQVVIYAGPKEFRLLSQIAEAYQNRADAVMNFGTGYVAFWGIGTFFAKLLLSAMNALHDLTGLGYGWTIVLITILIKALFWPLTAKATRSMKRMQALQPEVAALKEKYKDDTQKFTQKQMELWKKHKVSPVSGCLPMLIQMPVFIGFFTMIRSAIELRGAHFLWVADLSKPDTLFMIPGITFIPFGISTPEGLPFNLLPLLMGGAMLWQSHLQPPSPGMDPAQQKMMRWLPAMFILFLYNYSAGLALYWTVNNLLTILQTKLTKSLKDPMAGPATNPALTPASKSKK